MVSLIILGSPALLESAARRWAVTWASSVFCEFSAVNISDGTWRVIHTKIRPDLFIFRRLAKLGACFSVDQSVRLEAGDRKGIQRLIQYFLRCPFSQARMIEVTDEGKVLYKTGDNGLGRFPEAVSDDLLPGPKRNFQIFDPLDFLAEVTQHIPEQGEHLIRYYGWYSNKKRGQRAKTQRPTPEGSAAPPLTPSFHTRFRGGFSLI